jgi:hypothetical protein
VARVPVAPVAVGADPPAATVSGGQFVAQAPVQVDLFGVASGLKTYRVLPSAPARYWPAVALVATVSVKAPPAAAEGASEAALDAGAALGAVDSAAVDAAAVGAALAPPPDEQAAATSSAATSPEALLKFVVRIELNMGRLLDLKDVLDHSPGDALHYVGAAPVVLPTPSGR